MVMITTIDCRKECKDLEIFLFFTPQLKVTVSTAVHRLIFPSAVRKIVKSLRIENLDILPLNKQHLFIH